MKYSFIYFLVLQHTDVYTLYICIQMYTAVQVLTEVAEQSNWTGGSERG